MTTYRIGYNEYVTSGGKSLGNPDPLRAGRQTESITQQRVFNALTTARSQLAFDETYGNATLTLKKQPANVAKFVEAAVQRALQFLIDEGSVEILEVRVESAPGRLAYLVVWKDVNSQIVNRISF